MIEKIKYLLDLAEVIGIEKSLQILQEWREGEVSKDFCVILDAGHGGIDPRTGRYTTAPAKMCDHGDFVFYEGVFNRQVVAKIGELLAQNGIQYYIVSHPTDDTPLSQRTDLANEIAGGYKNAVFMSIHGNAAASSAAIGFEVFTSRGQTRSDKLAELLLQEMEVSFPKWKFRRDITDGDGDKEAGFYVLRKTSMPAILSENGFFTNKKEAIRMMTDDFQKRCAIAHVNAVKRYIQTLQ